MSVTGHERPVGIAAEFSANQPLTRRPAPGDSTTGLDATAIASVVCLSVAPLALMPSVARADLIQIDDLGESIVVTFTSTGSGSLGTITNTGESVIIPHTYWQHVGLCRERRGGVVTVTLKGQASRRTHAS